MGPWQSGLQVTMTRRGGCESWPASSTIQAFAAERAIETAWPAHAVGTPHGGGVMLSFMSFTEKAGREFGVTAEVELPVRYAAGSASRGVGRVCRPRWLWPGVDWILY